MEPGRGEKLSPEDSVRASEEAAPGTRPDSPCVSMMLVKFCLAFDLGDSDVRVELRYLLSLYRNSSSYHAHQLPSPLFLLPSLLTLLVTITEKFGVIIILID